jgi:transmembrane sensor
MNEQEFKKLLDAYVRGKATDKEQDLLDQFFRSYQKQSDSIQVEQEDLALLEEKLRNKIDKKIHPRRYTGITRWAIPFAACISISIISAYIFSISNKPVEKENIVEVIPQVEKKTIKGQKLTLKLSDGTVVKLNANSSLKYPQKFANTAREVELVGEAYFTVTKNPDVPFVVRTQQASTVVLGTSFNVLARAQDNTKVTLVEGKVKIASTPNPSRYVFLHPNQQAIVKEGEELIDTVSVDVARFIEWKDGILTFEHTHMDQVVERLEEWYGVEIKLKDPVLKTCRITARYEAEPLENVLESFAFMLKGQFTLDGKKVTLTAKGCKGNI